MGQFRISARGVIIPDRDWEGYEEYMKLAREVLGDDVVDRIDWEAKRKEKFNEKDPALRASWAWPLPASPLSSYEEAGEWTRTLPKLGEGKTVEEEKEIERALGNFALMFFDPVRVDWLQLGVVPNRRTVFTKGGEDWKAKIVVP